MNSNTVDRPIEEIIKSMTEMVIKWQHSTQNPQFLRDLDKLCNFAHKYVEVEKNENRD